MPEMFILDFGLDGTETPRYMWNIAGRWMPGDERLGGGMADQGRPGETPGFWGIGQQMRLRGRLICCQKDLSGTRGTFGPLGNVASNGCGFIALYNVFCLLGYQTAADAVLRRMNRVWWRSMLFGGLLGSNPFYLWQSVRKLPGVRCQCVVCFGSPKGRNRRWGKKLQQIDKAQDVFLNLYLYRKGAHYTAAEYRDGSFYIYNDWCRPKDHEAYYRQVKALGMIVLGISKRRKADDEVGNLSSGTEGPGRRNQR